MPELSQQLPILKSREKLSASVISSVIVNLDLAEGKDRQSKILSHSAVERHAPLPLSDLFSFCFGLFDVPEEPSLSFSFLLWLRAEEAMGRGVMCEERNTGDSSEWKIH